MGAHTGIERFVPAIERRIPKPLFIPELGAVVEVLIAALYIVHQNVEPALLGLDALEHRAHLGIITGSVGVVAGQGNPTASTRRTKLSHLGRSLMEVARHRHSSLTLLDRARGYVDCCACLAQCLCRCRGSRR